MISILLSDNLKLAMKLYMGKVKMGKFKRFKI
jgi:hypothetical protein